ncbi:MAG: carboxypeptidase-like regulatory domain-containing protein [Gemmatimonadaceae bacterium]|nr:carboxypeptidase-like regulatory domain-containing protein [Chitinophagaceae bacterium]
MIALNLIFLFSHAQTRISGKVKDAKGRPVPGASVAVKDTYDGATSDSTGLFSFATTEKGPRILLITSIGYKILEQPLTLGDAAINMDFILKEEPNELKAVVVTAGTFEASDSKRTTVLNPIDIVTTASANADVTAAIRTLPGTQQVGEKEGLFVRGGSGEEARVFIDGTLVNNFFFSSVPDIAQRGRFSPFLFKGTVFSSGGYSALYGQALSGALILETIDLPEQSSASIGLSTVGVNGGFQQLAKNKKSSWGVGYSYTNLYPYFKIIKQGPDNFRTPVLHNGEANFRIKTSKTGIVKFYGYFNTTDLGIRRPDIDSTSLKNAFDLKNLNIYTNLSWKEKLGKKWKLNVGASFSDNTDKIGNELQNQQNVKQQIYTNPYVSKSFRLKSGSQLATVKTVFERRLKGLSALRFGGEYLYFKDRTDFSNLYVNNAITTQVDKLGAAFAEADIYVTYDIAAKIGGRFENSSILQKSNFAPRASLAYKMGEGQFSMAYGIFYQKPERTYMLFGNTDLQYQKATHYILNYQRVSKDYTIRAEVFYKKYEDLIKIFPDTNNNGYGNAKGFELFWRDRKTFKNVDYWISYSYLDTKRDYLNYPMSIQPNFAANHTANLVVKKFVTNWKTQFNASYTFATGRPYYNIRYDNGASKYYIADQGKTIAYNSLSISINYLPTIGKTTKNFVVWVFSINNVLGSNQVFNYNYSANGLRKEAVVPTAKRFIFLGCFLSFGVDRSDDVINSNL